MQKALLLKLFIITFLTAIITIPLEMIHSTIDERLTFHDQAVRSIADDSVREQTVTGPLLIIPYTDEFEVPEDTAASERKDTVHVQHAVHKKLVVYPNNLNIAGNIDIDQRYRGIHKVLVYTGQHAISGNFVLPQGDLFEREKKSSKITIGQAYISVGIDDVRGIHQIPSVEFNGQKFDFQQGSSLAAMPSGLNAPIGVIDLEHATPLNFSFNLNLDGIERLSFTPVGKNNQVTLTSKWPHPEFSGRFLPAPHNRTINSSGFTATWDISSLATNTQQQLNALIFQKMPDDHTTPASQGVQAVDSFSVSFIEPINIYSQADRAVKYGLLFVVLTFAAFFIFEVLKQLPIHPVQYALVGFALALFFLLLVSLSEQIPFALAYLIASVACIVLNGIYLSYVLRNWKRGFGFGAALTLLYSVLYGVLQSENNALLMGSVLLFSVLAAIMIATRKVDWYQIGKSGMLPASNSIELG